MDGKRRAAVLAAAMAALLGGGLLLGRNAPAAGLSAHFWLGAAVGAALGVTIVAAILYRRGRSDCRPR